MGTKNHVDQILSQANSYEKMVAFTDSMLKYYRQAGCTEEVAQELKTLIGGRCIYYALNLRTKEKEENVASFYESGKESCIVVPSKDVWRVMKLIVTRNDALKDSKIMARVVN